MGKVIKILAKVIAATLLLSILIPLFGAVALTVPKIQNAVIQIASRFCSDYLGTRVTLGEVRLWPLYSVDIQDVYVEDYGGDTLMYAQRLNTRLIMAGKGRLSLGSTTIERGKFLLREHSEGVLNLKLLLERITNKDKSSDPFTTKISSVDLQNCEFQYTKVEPKCPEFGMDFTNMRFRNLNGRAEDVLVYGPRTTLNIDKMSGEDVSGFKIERLSGQLIADEGYINLLNAQVRSGKTRLYAPQISLTADSWDDYSDFNHSVIFDGQVRRSEINSHDIAYLLAALEPMDFELRSVDLDLHGSLDELNVDVLRADFGEKSRVKGSMMSQGLPEVERTNFDFDIENLASNIHDVNYILKGVGAPELTGATFDYALRAGDFTTKAAVNGLISDLKVVGRLFSQIGDVDYDVDVDRRGEITDVHGNFTTTNAQLGKVLEVNALGRVVAQADVDVKGISSNSQGLINVIAQVDSLDFRSYTYRDIAINSAIDRSRYQFDIDSRDPNAELRTNADIDLNSDLHSYNIDMDVMRCDLRALNLNHRDSISQLSGVVDIALTSTDISIDNLNGSVVISDVDYKYNDKSVQSDRILINAINEPSNKYLELHSDIAELTYRSKRDYGSVLSFLQNILHPYLPLLYNDSTPVEQQEQRLDQAADYSIVSLELKNISPWLDALSSDLNIAPGSNFYLLFNPSSGRLSMRGSAEYIERGNMLAINLDVNATNSADSLSVLANAKELYMGTTLFANCAVEAGARDNALKMRAEYRDTTTNASGIFGVNSLIARNDQGKRKLDLQITPSYITRGRRRWDITSGLITVDSSALSVNNFEMKNRTQRLTVKGVASKSVQDSLSLHLDNFDLSMLTQLTQSIGYNIEGNTSGDATVSAALGESKIEANIDMDSVSVNKIPSPALQLRARWNRELNRAGITVCRRSDRDTLIQGYCTPSDMSYMARVEIDSVSMGLLDPLMTSVIKDTEGYASTELMVEGDRENISLSGNILVEGLATTVDYTKVRYQAPVAHVTVEDSRFNAQNVELFDKEGNKALMTLNFDLGNLTNMSYRMRINPEHMMVLNTTLSDNELFYGRCYATGVGTVEGDKRGVKMDFTATTDDNTSMYMPLSTKSSVSTANFIKFAEPKIQVDTVDYISRRRLDFERSQRTGSSDAPDMQISMSLEVTPVAEFQLVIDPTVGDIIKGRGEGRLNVSINPKINQFEMYGDYTITEGNYLFTLQNIVNKRFIIDEGSTIQWTGNPLDAILNIDAVYQLKTSLQPLLGEDSSTSSTRAVPVDCVIHLGDRLLQPSVSFGISLPSADIEQQTMLANILNDQEAISRQFFYLMIANSFIPENSTNAIASMGTNTTATTGFELLTNQLSNWLSTSNYSLILRYRPESEMAGDEVDFGFSKGWIDNRLLVEVEGNYVSDYKGTAINQDMSNLMGEAYVTWLIDKAGALRLRGFSQTIDRFDENQGLQETGLGVYYRESFDNFADLRRRVRNRFSDMGLAKPKNEEKQQNEKDDK